MKIYYHSGRRLRGILPASGVLISLEDNVTPDPWKPSALNCCLSSLLSIGRGVTKRGFDVGDPQ